MNQKYSVNEIYYSIQGEGVYTGVPMIFVRLAGCNLSCPFCDTKYALDEASGRQMSPEAIALEAKKLSTKAAYLCLTGGEPTLQSIGPLLAHLSIGWAIHIETNGTIPPTPGLGLSHHHIVLSPKREQLPVFSMIEIADEIKLVVDTPDIFDDPLFRPFFDRARDRTALRRTSFSLQPESNRREMIKLCVEFIKENPQWRLSLQMHKLLGVR